MRGPLRPCMFEPVFFYFIPVFLYATWTMSARGFAFISNVGIGW